MARRRSRSNSSEQAVVALVRQLGAALRDLGLGEIDVACGDIRVRIQRQGAGASAVSVASVDHAMGGSTPLIVDTAASSATMVEAPMVGTFYRAPSPNAEPYVREGDVVKEGQVLCIIEAMKLMNEIESKVGGRVAKVLVENGHAVEYGQGLFLIEPV